MKTLTKAILVLAISLSPVAGRTEDMPKLQRYSPEFSRGFSGEAMSPNEAQAFFDLELHERFDILRAQMELEHKSADYLVATKRIANLWAEALLDSNLSKPLTFSEWLQSEPVRSDSSQRSDDVLQVSAKLQTFLNNILLMLAAVRNGHNLIAARELGFVVNSANSFREDSFYFEGKKGEFPKFSKFINDVLTEALKLIEPRTTTETQRLRDFRQYLSDWEQGGWKDSASIADLNPRRLIIAEACKQSAKLCIYAIPIMGIPILAISALPDTFNDSKELFNVLLVILGSALTGMGASLAMYPHMDPYIDRTFTPKYRAHPTVSVFSNECHALLNKSLK